MKYICVILLVFCEAVTAQNSEVKSYYENIYRSEACILNNQLDSSSFYFSKAFEAMRFPFARNVFNAAIVDAKLANYKNVFKYCTYLLQLGASYHKLSSDTSFGAFFVSPYGKKLRTSHKSIKPIYNNQYRSVIIKMVKDDQFYRQKPNGYRIYGDTIKAIDKRNIAALLQNIKKYGFPSEYNVGVDSGRLTMPLYTVIVIHQSSGALQQYDFSNILTRAVLDGDIENKAGAFMINRSSGSNWFEVMKLQLIKVIDTTLNPSDPNNINILKETDWGYFPLNEKELRQADEQRANLYLDGWEANIRKVLFGLKQQQYLMFSAGANTRLNYTSAEGFEIDSGKMKFLQ
jgi:hypothetical protein